MRAAAIGAVVALLAGCCPADPTSHPAPDAGADAGGDSAIDPCDCAYAIEACAVSGYTCGVRVGCAVAHRRTADGGAEDVDPSVCPVPLTERGKVVALCLQGGACAAGDGGVVLRAEVE